jgi:hypothetical protein
MQCVVRYQSLSKTAAAAAAAAICRNMQQPAPVACYTQSRAKQFINQPLEVQQITVAHCTYKFFYF